MGAALLVVWATTAVAQSRTVYLNRDGATLRPGTNDTRAHTSTVVSQPTTIAPWATTDALWTATVACMRETWSRFDVTFVKRVDADSGRKFQVPTRIQFRVHGSHAGPAVRPDYT